MPHRVPPGQTRPLHGAVGPPRRRSGWTIRLEVESQCVASPWYGTLPIFSPDGKRLVTQDPVDQAATLLWDTTSWLRVAQVKGTAPVFSPDGRLVATCQSLDSQGNCGDHPEQTLTLLWRSADGGTVSQVKGAAPLFSPDGRLAATHNAIAGTLLSNATDGATIAYLTDDRVAFSPDGRWLAGASASGLTIYPITANGMGQAQHLSTETIYEGPVFSADGQRIIMRGGDSAASGLFVTWSLAERRELARAEHGGDAVSMSPHGTTIEVFGSAGDGCGSMTIYRGSDGKSLIEGSSCSQFFFSSALALMAHG